MQLQDKTRLSSRLHNNIIDSFVAAYSNIYSMWKCIDSIDSLDNY